MTNQQKKDRKLLDKILLENKYPTNSSIIRMSKTHRERVIRWFGKVLRNNNQNRTEFSSGKTIADSLGMTENNFYKIMKSLNHIIYRTGKEQTKSGSGGVRRYWRVRRDVLLELNGTKDDAQPKRRPYKAPKLRIIDSPQEVQRILDELEVEQLFTQEA